MRARWIVALLCAISFAAVVAAQPRHVSKAITKAGATAHAKQTAAKNDEQAGTQEFTLAEGEKRFRQNCGRCHLAPDKFPPRMMATIVRHMRVRATITDRDARLILWYMTQ